MRADGSPSGVAVATTIRRRRRRRRAEPRRTSGRTGQTGSASTSSRRARHGSLRYVACADERPEGRRQVPCRRARELCDGYSPHSGRHPGRRGDPCLLHRGHGLRSREGRWSPRPTAAAGPATSSTTPRAGPDRVLGHPRRRDVPADFDAVDLSQGLGLPAWTNHLAFDAVDLDGLAEHKRRWLDGRPRRRRDRPRLVHVDLHRGPQRDHGGVLRHHRGSSPPPTATTGPDAAGDRQPELVPPPDVSSTKHREGRRSGVGSLVTRIGRLRQPYLVAEWHRDPPAGHACEPAHARDRRPGGRARLALRARRRAHRGAADAPARELLPPLRGAGARRGRLRGVVRQQPLAQQRRHAAARGRAARRRRRDRRRCARPLRPRRAARQLGWRLAAHLLRAAGAGAERAGA